VATDRPGDLLKAAHYDLVRLKARRLCRQRPFRAGDGADIEQELYAGLLRQLAHFDNTKGNLDRFVSAGLVRAVVDLLRRRGAGKRDTSRTISLQAPVVGTAGREELATTVGERENNARIGRSARSDLDRTDLVRDAADLIAALPPQQRELAERLESQPLAEAARAMNVPYSTAQYWVTKIRERFEAAGFLDYFS